MYDHYWRKLLITPRRPGDVSKLAALLATQREIMGEHLTQPWLPRDYLGNGNSRTLRAPSNE
jgi:hypothetical protein